MSQVSQKSSRIAGFFDVDGSWYRWQIVSRWFDQAVKDGLIPESSAQEVRALYEQFKARKGTFSAYINKIVELYPRDLVAAEVTTEQARQSAQRMMQTHGSRIHLFVQALSETLIHHNIERVIISGSLKEAVDVFAEANGIVHRFGSELNTDDSGRYITGVKKEWVSDKSEAVRLKADELKLNLARCLAIGDTMGDVKMFECVGYPICINPKDKLLPVAREKRWPVVWEKATSLMILKALDGTTFVEVPLQEIVPRFLQDTFRSKLREYFPHARL